MQDERNRRAGCVLVGVVAVLFAQHIGMPGWELGVVFALATLGLQLMVVGRLWSSRDATA